MALVLKLDETTKAPIVTDDQKIIYYDDEDSTQADLPLDPVGMYTKIGELGKQNKTDRDNFTAIRDKFADFGKIDDLPDWKKKADAALVTVENFNDKDWMKADKVEKLKVEMKESYDGQLTEKDTILKDTIELHTGILQGKDAIIRGLMVSSKFATSPYFTGKDKKTILPPDIGESYFGKHYRVEEIEGKEKPVLRAYHDNGDVINSKTNPGEPATFEEAMGIIIDLYPGKDAILSVTGGGSGGQGGKGGDGDDATLADLKKQHAEALAGGFHQKAIGLKNQIFEIEHAQ